MKPAMPKTRRSRQEGYTLLLVVFLVAAMIIAAAAAAPSILTEGRREKEAEMVWRGEQYERAIGKYYQKFGKYPTKVEDLTRQTNGVRFLRQAYTDPMNKEDGSWRFIYVGPNGQLIGSLRPANLLQNALTAPGLGGALTSGGGMQTPSMPGATAPIGANQTPGMGQAVPPGQPGQQAGGAGTANPLESQPQPLEGDILGGNIIGVGSKVKKPSLRIYFGGDTYQTWEFIWNPTPQLGMPGQPPVNPNANPTATPNANNPNATTPSSPDGQQPQMPNANVPPTPAQ